MARKRQIDPEFFADEELAEFSYKGRLFYIGTWVNCEDTGVFEVKFKTLKTKIFPYNRGDIAALYEQIRDKGKFVEYQVNGGTYAFIKGFHKRQTIQYPSRSFLPLPPEPYKTLIPLKIRQLNGYSMGTQRAINEGSSGIELSRIELSRDEVKDLKKLFSSKSKIKQHLETRGYKAEAVEEIIKKHFSALKK